MKNLLLTFLGLFWVIAVQAQSGLTTSVTDPVCSGAEIPVYFSDTVNTYQPGNVFMVQLSDTQGSFANPSIIGQAAGSLALGIILATLPATTGSGYRIRVVSTDPIIIGADNGADLTISPFPAVYATSNSPICEGQTLTLNTTNVPGTTYSWSGPHITSPFHSTLRNPSRDNLQLYMAGSYEVTVSLNGCTSTDNVYVHINPRPSAPVPPFFGGLCPGAEFCVTQGNWTAPWGEVLIAPFCIQNIQPGHAGSYTTTVTVNGCTSLPAYLNLVLNPSPSVQAIAFDTLISAGETATLLALSTGANTYSWMGPPSGGVIPNPSFTQVQVSPTSTTTYTVIGYNSFGCTDSAFVTVYVEIVSAPEGLQASNSMQIHPNPNNGNFTITLEDSKEGGIEFRLMNLLGQEVYSEAANAKNNGFTYQLNMQQIPEGVYLLQVVQGNRLMTKRVVVHR